MASFLCRGNLLSHNFRTWSYWHAKATKAAKGSTHLFCHQHMTPCHLRMQCRSVWMALNADRNAIVGLHLLAAAFGSIPLGWPVLDRFLFIWLVTFPTYDAAIMRPFRPAPHLLGSPTVAAARVIWQKFFPRLEGFGVVNRLVFSTAFWAKSNKALRKVLVAYKAFWAAIRLLIPFGLRTGFAASLRSVWTAIIVFRIFCIHTRVNVFHPGGRNSFGKQKH